MFTNKSIRMSMKTFKLLHFNRYFSSVTSQPPPVGKAKFNLSSKVALVTASTDGIGFSIAQRLAQSGATVLISSRKLANVERAVQQLKDEGLQSVDGLVCHVGNPDDRLKLVEYIKTKYNGLDIFVSNAATNPAVGPILDIFEINVKSAFLMTKLLVPLMERRKGDKSIVYISSIAGYQIMPAIATYSVSKTALLGLTKAVALNCASMQIRVNCVCPGIIKTKFSQVLWQNDSFQDGFGSMALIDRVGESNEISSLVTFLVSEEASYITGESFVAAGGIYSRL
ncbi:sodium/potassium-transporting ATPase subunit alpha-like [Sarcoptes scabiei]|nr:sodium/potassium-transporting ATPase subunit alpha-like [Sarcoptes scabiei]